MNLGDNRWHRKYICDKCKEEIPFIKQKGFVGINHYYRSTQRETIKGNFDLCSKCERDFREWLNIKPIRYGIEMFDIYEEESDE